MTGPADNEERSGLPPRRVLAIADLTPAARNALWRAGRIAREYGAGLHVLHVLRDGRGAAQAQRSLHQLCTALQERLDLPCELEVVRGDFKREVIRAAREASLLVLASRPEQSLRDRIAGAALQRVIRLCRIPTMVVKRPAVPPRDASRGDEALRGRYARVLVSVDIARETAGVIEAACWFSDDPAMEVFHALSARRDDGATARPGTADAGPATAVERARASLRAQIVASGADLDGATAMVGFGLAAPSVLARQRALGAELVVLGKRQRGPFADYFLGGITRRIVAETRSDVLVVPA